MEEEILLYLETTEENMQESIDHFKKGLSRIRSGKANPSMLDGVMVDYYGAMTPLNQVASIKQSMDALLFFLLGKKLC